MRFLGVLILMIGFVHPLLAADVSDLRLVPFPKQVEFRPGHFRLDRPLILQLPQELVPAAERILVREFRLWKLDPPRLEVAADHRVLLFAGPAAAVPPLLPPFRQDASAEDYALDIAPDTVVIRSPDDAGLRHGLQTLCQLVRANRAPEGLPCVQIRDWPSLRWRCFQDDLTRGPSSTLQTLKNEADLGALFKFNLFTYYMEYQFAFKKHPLIGPKDGSLLPEELSELVSYARPLGIDILGNQQSFGHFGWILRHPQYKDLRETGDVLTPVNEKTYQLLDDMYSEVLPLLPFGMFNVCCDETYGLGQGPAKELAAKIGVGGAYVQHLKRIRELITGKYKKRMMMWGDIILQHPDKLNDIPKDVIMLTWGYDPRDSFEDQIIPFAKSGYEFFVCPGLNNWSRIIPDFAAANTNIRNFVRDGAKHKAWGMLNTSWEDDGESLKGIIWHGHAWAAECAWNASQTQPADFDRRIGAVLFGRGGARFGEAISLLSRIPRLPGMNGAFNARFWKDDFISARPAAQVAAEAQAVLDLVRPAIRILQTCRNDAALNQHLLDCHILGAQRLELIGQRMLDGISVQEHYRAAIKTTDAAQRLQSLDAAIELLRRNREAHDRLGQRFKELWLAESRPYALDWTIKRYEARIGWFEERMRKLEAAKKQAQSGQALPPLAEVGLIPPPEPKK